MNKVTISLSKLKIRMTVQVDRDTASAESLIYRRSGISVYASTKTHLERENIKIGLCMDENDDPTKIKETISEFHFFSQELFSAYVSMLADFRHEARFLSLVSTYEPLNISIESEI